MARIRRNAAIIGASKPVVPPPYGMAITHDSGASVYPLLTGVSMQDDFGVHPGEPGMFTATDNGIGDLNIVLDDMKGKTDNRESIPSPFSQTEAYQITLKLYSHLEESKNLVNQWRGALCLAMLYPLLLRGANRPVWRSNKVNDDNVNHFISLVARCRSSHPLSMHALCVLRIKPETVNGVRQEHKIYYPLLYCSDVCGVVPVASGIEEGLCDLPWLKPRDGNPEIMGNGHNALFFTDPTEHLSLGQCELMLEGLRLFLKAHPGKITVAVNAFIDALTKRKDDLTREKPYRTLEQALLIGLSMRNTVDIGLHVAAVAPEAVEEGSANADPKRAVCALAGQLCAPHPSLVLLRGCIVAYLDNAQVLHLTNPSRMLECLSQDQAAAPTDETLACKALMKLRDAFYTQNIQINPQYQLLQYQLARLRQAFPDCEWVAEMAVQLNATLSYTPIRLPFTPIRALPDEVDLTKGVFKPFALLVSLNIDPGLLFSQELIYAETDSRYYRDDMVMSMIELITQSNKYYYLLHPVDQYGAMALLQCAGAKLTATSSDNKGKIAFKVTLSVRDDYLEYSQTKEFANDQLRQFDPPLLPCVALWADVKESNRYKPNPWNLYYVFVSFLLSNDSPEYSAEAYTHAGDAIAESHQVYRQEVMYPLTQWWHTFCLNSSPGYLLFKHNSLSAGMLRFTGNAKQETATLENNESLIRLAIDFGTTTTAVASQAGPGGQIIVQGLDCNHVTWLLNRSEGQENAAKHFISDGLCRRSGPDTIVPTLVRMLRSPDELSEDGSQVHLDGNIAYQTNEDGSDNNIHGGFKIILHSDSIHHSDYVKMQQMYTRIFIKQMLQMHLLRCRKEKAARIDVRFATPLALTVDEKKTLMEIFNSVTNEVAAQAGFNVTNDVQVRFTTESMAVGAYFHRNSPVIALGQDGGIFTLDIGGGTSDYSFWNRANNKVNAFVCCSNHLAGHEIFSHYLYQELVDAKSIRYFTDAVEACVPPGAAALTTYLPNLLKNIRNLKPTDSNAENKLYRWIDQLFKYDEKLMEAAINHPNMLPVLSVVNFQIALLFWVGTLVISIISQQQRRNPMKNKATLCLAGNGGNFYQLLSLDRKTAIEAMFDQLGTPIQIYQSNQLTERKMEVAKGLLTDDSIFDMETDDPINPLNPDISGVVGHDLMRFLHAYADIFGLPPIADPFAMELSNVLNNDRMLTNLEEFILSSLSTLENLNRNLVVFRTRLFQCVQSI